MQSVPVTAITNAQLMITLSTHCTAILKIGGGKRERVCARVCSMTKHSLLIAHFKQLSGAAELLLDYCSGLYFCQFQGVHDTLTIIYT